jgi:hypothetical protein
MEYLNVESPFDRLCKEKEKDGWRYCGYEKLTITTFDRDARFVEKPFQTEEQIIAKYKRSDNEVELVLAPNEKMDALRKILSEEELKQIEPNDADKNYYVFVREKGPPSPRQWSMTRNVRS